MGGMYTPSNPPPFCYYFLISELTIIVYNLVLSVKSVPESVFG